MSAPTRHAPSRGSSPEGLRYLRAIGVRLSFWNAHRLTFIGFFFNNVVPGATGGDVVKAVYVARTARGAGA